MWLSCPVLFGHTARTWGGTGEWPCRASLAQAQAGLVSHYHAKQLSVSLSQNCLCHAPAQGDRGSLPSKAHWNAGTGCCSALAVSFLILRLASALKHEKEESALFLQWGSLCLGRSTEEFGISCLLFPFSNSMYPAWDLPFLALRLTALA